jgi:ParB family chromosome partitioning protein
MSSSVAEPLSAPSVGPEFFRPDLPLAQLQSSPLNPRKHFDEARLVELADSFRAVGIIEPLVVRPAGDHYEIICGDRRSRAARLAGLVAVPVIVKHLTDAQALELMVIENNQREDVNPLEEGDGFKRLLEAGYELDKLAERLGRSKKYVYDRIKLQDLEPQPKQLLLAGKLTAGHAILIARLKPADQARALDPMSGGAFTRDLGASADDEERAEQAWESHHEGSEDRYADVKPASVRELNRWIANHVRFDVEHAAAAVPHEYGEAAQRVRSAAERPGRGKKVIAITFDHYIQPDTRDESERTFGPQSFRVADGREHYDSYTGRAAIAPPCEFSVLGVVAAGTERYGQVLDVCIARDKCQVHWKKEIAEKAKNQKLRESGQASKAAKNEAQQQENWRQKYERERQEAERQSKAWAAVRVTAIERFAAALKKLPAARAAEDAWDLLAEYLNASDGKLLERLVGKVTAANLPAAVVLMKALDEFRSHDDFVKYAREHASVDLKDLTAQYKQLLAPAAAASTSAPTSKPKSKAAKKKR